VSLPAGERPGTINQELPEAQMDMQRALAAQPALQYRAEGDDTRYYLDADMQSTASAAPGGYYYKSLGKTDDNRSVLQIFTPTATVLTAHRSPSSPTSYRKISVNPE